MHIDMHIRIHLHTHMHMHVHIHTHVHFWEVDLLSIDLVAILAQHQSFFSYNKVWLRPLSGHHGGRCHAGHWIVPNEGMQVLQVQKKDVFSTTSSSLVDVTGLTLNITPSATSSKILFMASVAGVGTDNAVVQAYRDSTIIAGGDASGSRTQSFTGSLYNGIFSAPTLMTASINWLDTPSTTSAITYKIKAGAVDYIVYGSITKFGSKRKTIKTSGINVTKLISEFGVDLKLVDVTTGEIVKAKSIDETIETGASTSTNSFGTSDVLADPLSEIQRTAAKSAAALCTAPSVNAALPENSRLFPWITQPWARERSSLSATEEPRGLRRERR